MDLLLNVNVDCFIHFTNYKDSFLRLWAMTFNASAFKWKDQSEYKLDLAVYIVTFFTAWMIKNLESSAGRGNPDIQYNTYVCVCVLRDGGWQGSNAFKR